MPSTIIAWRFVKQKHASTAFTGEGAKLYGGRWNQQGVAAVYTSDSLSLAVIEQLVHIKPEDIIRLHYCSIKLEIPDSLAIEEIKSLPADWDADPIPEITKNIGTDWLLSGRTAVLKVPSSIIKVQFNYVLNPLHPDFKKIKVYPPEKFDQGHLRRIIPS